MLFPVTNRVHLARQKRLLDELKAVGVEVKILEMIPEGPYGDMAARATQTAKAADNVIKDAEMVLIRGDRYEMLPIAMVASYRGIPIAHIESGDLSGAIDNKARHAIAHLADYYFPTNTPAEERLVKMGMLPNRIYNFGSLDVEIAALHKPKQVFKEEYVVFAFHPVDDERESEVYKWVKQAVGDMRIVHIRSNGDYSLPDKNGEEFTGDRYLDLIAGATLLVGNSSSFIKEASVYGTPVVNVGSRQQNRLTPRSVFSAGYDRHLVQHAIAVQLDYGRYPIHSPYLKPETAKNIAGTIKGLL